MVVKFIFVKLTRSNPKMFIQQRINICIDEVQTLKLRIAVLIIDKVLNLISKCSNPSIASYVRNFDS